MIIGIDLGTTNSLAAVWKDGEARIVPNALGEALTPSVVGLDDTGEVLVGMAARERLLTHPELTAAAFKRQMGSDREFHLGKRKFRPEELSSLVLRALKADAEAWLGEEVKEAVVSVPAYFNDAQRKATKVAGQLAGLTVERLINEPTAAALAYGLHRRDVESKFLIFDLGGGTFDVSLLELFEGIMEVQASGGDNFLGGEDFVDQLVGAFMERVGREAGIGEEDLEGKALQALRDQAERAKREITKHEAGTLHLTWQDQTLSWNVGETFFAELCEPLLARLAAPIERALRDARIPAGELDEVVLVGGATRMPIVRKLVARMFGRLPAVHLSPDEAIALGTAVQAGLKARDGALDEVVMTDVCPYTLGTEVAEVFGKGHVRDGFFMPIIERNTTIPASRVERVSTVQNYQSEVAIKIFQGESRQVQDNIFLGEIKLRVPPHPAGEEAMDIRFTYDINGLLEVEATVLSTERTERLVIEQNPGVLSPEEIEKRLGALAELKIHPREHTENRTALARAERLYEERLGELRHFLGEQIAQFEAVLAYQDPREIEEARDTLTELLNEIEGLPYL
ncbi:MAG: molecular chaperone HscC [Rhodospirillales bacterium]|nr:molecular chaperone HscC [Rhodospirillales bacterium]MDH3919020.1 molecular chaperone HscC [Rhodospirillales bacterium]MDH3968843.1 molecular chaperone HscC [Rhodospirillales bacterium]